MLEESYGQSAKRLDGTAVADNKGSPHDDASQDEKPVCLKHCMGVFAAPC